MGLNLNGVSKFICSGWVNFCYYSLWGSILIPKSKLIYDSLQSNMNIHLWILNSSRPRACTSSIILSPASRKLCDCSYLDLVNIWMSRAIRLGQMDLNILLRAFYDNLINSTLMQNRMRIRRAGEGFYAFITLLNDSSTTLSFFSYLSTRPQKIRKHTLSKFLI